ncbi:iron complex outermembrane receptor protein [Catalinimonas alkaloidigena]|uniref:TonB-dependent receptor n=1 Tax=Catalinimonas alkaloidigena TaxID=1075417 RepID=UPI002405A28F|nr:TonB-dependent receptor [Catalinimonas alkaloidigena]MDF9795166.1 iron complex outermembrane receptor protein [Catalinimonas alkaloidigena]
MRTYLRLLILGVNLLCISISPLKAQSSTSVSGKVLDEASNAPLIGVNILVKGKVIGTITDTDGNFELTINDSPPLTLVVSSVGYQPKEVVVSEAQSTDLTIMLSEQAILGQEIVVSASRVEESILQSPVSIEKMDIRDIQSAAAPSFYDQIANLKGIDVSAQSLTFKSINPRGFGANGNTRVVQLIDGIDNQAPGLNFPVGNIVGIPELDLESVELLPGSASALYGPNAINGIILMNSKNPFEYQGLSVAAKLGITHIDGEDDDPGLYQSYGLRYAKAFNNRIAFKLNAEYLKAVDFIGVDYRDAQDLVERSPEGIDPNERNSRTYDGVNVYGDPLLNVGILGIGSGAEALLPLDERGNFTPTGYTEKEFVDNTTESLKLGGAIHYRINDKLEALAQFNQGFGSTVYTANDRFVLDDFSIWTAKAELRGTNFFLRGYRTQENSGDSYAANTLATLINVQTTIPTYVQGFAAVRLVGGSIDDAHALARTVSDNLREQNLNNGRFQELYDSLRQVPISEGGAKFLDETSLTHFEGMYNLSEQVDFAEVIVGANYRRYNLKSDGTLFALQDNGDEFDIDEWGAYIQLTKKLLDDKLDLTGSVRYDKNEYFDGQFSPRISGVYTAQGNHNFRASFQRGFRIPTTQDQFIDLDVVTRRLIGSNSVLVDRYNFESNTVYTTQSVIAAQQAYQADGDLAAARAILDPVEFEAFDTEKVNTFEVGYKGLINNKLLIDAYYYYSAYQDFVAEIDFAQTALGGNNGNPPYEGPANPDGIVTQSVPLQRFGFDVNADGTVNAHGFAAAVDYSLSKGYTLGGNVAYNKLIDQDDLIAQGFRAAYNTPEWRYNIRFANRKVTEELGFNIVWRWQDAFLWESSIGEGVIPAYQTLDAQVSYKIPELKTVLKVGGSNILNERFTTSFANPRMGALYYVSLTFDEFLN